ncbi:MULTISPECIES: tyrosine-protein phosphatase [Emticicia]|uniref:tyrosine-protein phosphatase n=1 Tax=Emticicia TaxID=312278 RepID=UPI0007D8ABF4|nr:MULTISPECIES: CpsB/CapC family capsule biosynthesis tyrosine phosphatase [Emticicia]
MFKSIFRRGDLSKETNTQNSHLRVDIHAHLLPQLDDGPTDIEQSIEIIQEMYDIGYRKLILTPHVMSGYYNNTTEGILNSLQILKSTLLQQNIQMELEAAAEYYVEDNLFRLIERREALTFGGSRQYLLFEVSFVSKVSCIIEAATKIRQAGYTPVLAHPERYISLQDKNIIERLILNGIIFQLNIGSLTGYYSKQAQEIAEFIISKNLAVFWGTDCHSYNQLQSIKQTFKLNIFLEAMKQNVLNNSLLGERLISYA